MRSFVHRKGGPRSYLAPGEGDIKASNAFVTRGTRLMTYALEGPRGSGCICINGAAAHLNKPGDLVILSTFADMTPEEARQYKPVVVRVDRDVRPFRLRSCRAARSVIEVAAGRGDAFAAALLQPASVAPPGW